MLENVNEVAVLVSALLSLALGSIWYSPLVFGDAWMRSAGIDIRELHGTTNAMIVRVVVGFLVNACMLFVLAHLITFGEVAHMARTTLALYVGILIAGSLAFTVVWEKRPYTYYAIHMGYYALMIGVGIVVISYWPW